MAQTTGALLDRVFAKIPTPLDGPAPADTTPTLEAPVAIGEQTADKPSAEMKALRREEMVRARHFTPWVVGLCILGLVVQRFNHGGTYIQLLMASALLLLGATSAWVWWKVRDLGAYSGNTLRVFGIVAVLTSFVFELRVGVFSPIPAVVVLGLAFFGRSECKRAVWTLSGLSISLYLILAVLLSFDLFPDPGLFATKGLSLSSRLCIATSTAVVYVITVLQARMSRRSAEDMLALARDAALEARRRGAALDEANQNLDRALLAATGRGGAYTGTNAGIWSIGDVIGRGAMGEVYAATHGITGSPAAVKVLHTTLDGDDVDPVARFLREARIAASLRAPNLVDVYDVGEAEPCVPFIAMELLTGRDLAWKLRHERMPLAGVIELVGEVAAGLSVAHAAGVIHRDVKPQNLFLAEQSSGKPRWKILDFGICKLEGSNGTLTADGIVGTPSYMAPEQACGDRVDLRVDLFALGAVAYRAITGQPAFPGNTPMQILHGVVYENPVRPNTLVASIPRDIEYALAIALAKDPKDRFASAKEMANALSLAAESKLPMVFRRRADALLARVPWKTLPPPAAALNP